MRRVKRTLHGIFAVDARMKVSHVNREQSSLVAWPHPHAPSPGTWCAGYKSTWTLARPTSTRARRLLPPEFTIFKNLQVIFGLSPLSEAIHGGRSPPRITPVRACVRAWCLPASARKSKLA